jgi:hypothetical protein
MPLPSLAEHRAQVRTHLDALTSNAVYTDDEINQALLTALGVLARYVPITRTIIKSVTAGQTAIDLAPDCPAEAVTEIIWPNGATTTEFSVRSTIIYPRAPAPTNGNATIVYRHQPWVHASSNVTDWYPHAYRAAVVLHAAGALALARAIGLAETDPAKAAQISYAAQRTLADAMAMFRGDTQPYFTRTP